MKRLLTFFMILSLVILIPHAFAQESTNIPAWIKNNAAWWASDLIDDSAFLQGIQYLIKEGIIVIPQTETVGSSQTDQTVPAWVKNTAGWWATDAISETEFVNGLQYLIKVGIINVQKQLTPQIEIEKLFEKYIVEIPPDELNPYINSHGFRGPEIEKNKPDNTFRIFTVGGSTTFGDGVLEEFTWPSLLQENLDSLKATTKIEVVNAGQDSATSYSNSKLIKTKLISFEPDLIIVYEGVNDQSCLMQEYENANTSWTKQRIMGWCEVYLLDEYRFHMAKRYSELCEFAQKNGFDVIISLQPTVDLEGKILTSQEIYHYFERPQNSVLINDYEKLKKTILERTHGCNAVVDLSGIFDDYDLPIYYDYHHVGKLGNSIIAENISDLVVPILTEKNILDEKPNDLQTIKPKKYDMGQDLKNSDFSGKDLEDKNFFGADLSGSNFEGSILTNADFRLANLENTNFANAKIDNIKLRQNNLKNADFTNVDFSQVNLLNVDFTNVILKNSNLSKQDLTRTFFYKSDLSGADIINSNLEFVFFKDTVLKDVDLSASSLYEAELSLALDLSGIVLVGSNVAYVNLVGIDFSGKDLTDTNLSDANLSGVVFSDAILDGTLFRTADLTNANFEGVDSSPKQTYVELFKNKAHLADLSWSVLPVQLVGPDKWITSVMRIVNIEVRGNDLAVTYYLFNNFYRANLENANFANANLRSTLFVDANLSYADLSGADLRGANFNNAILTGANLENAMVADQTVLSCVGHSICTPN